MFLCLRRSDRRENDSMGHVWDHSTNAAKLQKFPGPDIVDGIVMTGNFKNYYHTTLTCSNL